MFRLFVGIFFILSSSIASNTIPLIKEVVKNYTMDYTKKTKCLVRHLYVYKDPKWVAKIELRNGKKYIFLALNRCLNFIIDPVNGLMLV